MESNSKKKGIKKKIFNFWSVVRFIFSSVLVLIVFAFSVINLFFKVQNSGWVISTYILAAASGLYLLLVAFYYILLKARLSEKSDKKLLSFIDDYKYFIKLVKLAIPIILLFNLIGNPVYDFFVVFFSIISIITSFINFAIATALLIRKKKKK